jgi:ribosomal protein S18 acetylase RimI-like enzyme
MNMRKAEYSDKDALIKLLHEFDEYYLKNNILSKEILEFEEEKDQDKDFEMCIVEYISSEKYLTYVAEENGNLIGYICGYIKNRPSKVLDKKGFVEDLFVKEEYRNNAIGKQLLSTLTDIFKNKGCTLLGLEVYASNQKSIDIYHKMGFIDEDISMTKRIN